MDLFGKDSATKSGTPADKHKQTIIVLASVGGVIVAYLAYKHMKSASATGATQTAAPSQIGVEGPGTTLNDQNILNSLDSMTGLLTDLAHRPLQVITGPAGPKGDTGAPGKSGVPDVVTKPVETPTAITPAAPAPATPAAPSAPAAAQHWYTVKKGDTLSGIAQRMGLGSNWGALKGANQQTITQTAENHGYSQKSAASGHWIFPGERLLVPQSPHPPTHAG